MNILRLWLKELRDASGLTHEQVADRSNISRSYYTNIELGVKTPKVEVAKSIGKALDFPWEYFFNDKCSLGEHPRSKEAI
ncbi:MULTISPECIES: helix-turn-helix transcriptional regulator [Paenibacillus]|uniref:helix-turn-helix transcriptional regulator n=1 Tax=Paenibacillus TaxID=44249 RepID=UPI0035A23CAF